MQENAERKEPGIENEINFVKKERIATDGEVSITKIVQTAETWEIVGGKGKLEQFVDVYWIEGGEGDSEDQGKLWENALKVVESHNGQCLELAGESVGEISEAEEEKDLNPPCEDIMIWANYWFRALN